MSTRALQAMQLGGGERNADVHFWTDEQIKSTELPRGHVRRRKGAREALVPALCNPLTFRGQQA